MNIHSEKLGVAVRAGQSTDKRQQIIAAAIKLFVKNGIHSTSMQQLAKQAGVATGSVYTYFDSKEALVLEIFHAIADESTDFLLQTYDSSRSVKQRFYHLLERKTRFNIDNPDKFRFMSMCVYEPIVMQGVQQENRCDKSPLAAVLIDGKAENVIKDLPLEDLFYHLFGGIGSLLEWRLFNQREISDADIVNMIEMSWDAIRKGAK